MRSSSQFLASEQLFGIAGNHVACHVSVASDHHLVVARLNMKLKATNKAKAANKQVAYNVHKLKDENVHKEYNIELQNRFEELTQMVDVEDEWENIRETINQTAESVIGKRRGTKKERWITHVEVH